MINAEQLRIISARDPGDILRRSFDAHRPSKAFVMLSGGKDSSVTLDYLWRKYATYITGVLHINTGIAISTTAPFARAFAEERGLEYVEQATPDSYDDIVLQHGMPGPAMHGICYNRLKERALDAFIRSQKRTRNDRIALITGVRAEESARRSKKCRDVRRDGSTVWVAPLIDWTSYDLVRHRDRFSVSMSPAASALHISGDCVCGAMVDDPTQSELSLIAAFDPVGERIRNLEKACARKGLRRCLWGVKDENDKAPFGVEDQVAMDLCVGCARSPQMEVA